MPGYNYSYENGKLIVNDQASEPIILDKVIPFIRLPLVRQATGYTCGVSCVCSILRYAGYDFEIRQDILSDILESNDEDGTSFKNIIEFLNNVEYVSNGKTTHPFKAYYREHMALSDLEAYIGEGKPVIVCIQAWSFEDDPVYDNDYDDGHYVIACGYDENNLYFMDPSTLGTYAFIPKDEFETRWHDMDTAGKVDQFGIIVEVNGEFNPGAVYHIG